MKFNKHQLSLYLVTDRRWLNGRSLEKDVETAIKNGVTMVQLREKNISDEEMIQIGYKLKDLCQKYRVPLIINDRIDVALKLDADGLHIGQDDMDILEARKKIGPDKILGVSAHTVEEALEAKYHGADYLGVGAMFNTTSKDDASDISLETLKEIIQITKLPVVAIGGINETNIDQLHVAPIDGVAVISAILASNNIAKSTHTLYQKVLDIKSQIKKVVTIAGSDSSGGAGIQADLKTMTALHTYGMSAITSLTAQNTTGVYGIYDVTPEFLGNQLDCIFKDIYPDAIKIGMVSNPDLIQMIVAKLKVYQAKNIVVDPVMVSTSGSKLMQDACITSLLQDLIPMATVITPNIPEAEIIANMKINTKEDMVQAAKKISTFYNGYILIKGGHFGEDASDLIYHDETSYWLEAPKLKNPNTHGTGCTLSSAIACFLAKGNDPVTAITYAKEYVYQAIAYGLNLGHGRGPLNHMWELNK